MQYPATGTASASAPSTGVPYLGPLPLPGHQYGVLMQITSVLCAVVWLARAVAYGMRAGLDADLGNGRPLASEAIRSNQSLLDALSPTGLVTIGAFVVASILWRQKRRPAGVLRSHGEAYVEAPFRIAMPIWFRVLGGVCVAIGVLGVQFGAVTTTATTDLAAHRWWYVIGSVGMIGVFAWEVVAVFLVTRHTEARLAWSGPYREVPLSVPYVAPVATGGVFERSVVDDKAEGGLWIITTLGLSLLGILGTLFVIGGMATLPGDEPVPALISLVLGIAMLTVLGLRIKARRHKRQAVPERLSIRTAGRNHGAPGVVRVED